MNGTRTRQLEDSVGRNTECSVSNVAARTGIMVAAPPYITGTGFRMATIRRDHWSRIHLTEKPRREPPLELVYERRSDSADNLERRKWLALANVALRSANPTEGRHPKNRRNTRGKNFTAAQELTDLALRVQRQVNNIEPITGPSDTARKEPMVEPSGSFPVLPSALPNY